LYFYSGQEQEEQWEASNAHCWCSDGAAGHVIGMGQALGDLPVHAHDEDVNHNVAQQIGNLSDNCQPVHGQTGKAAEKADKVAFVRNFLAMIKVKHNVSHAANAAFYQFFCMENHELVHNLATKGAFPSVKTMRRQLKADLPNISLTYAYKRSGSQETDSEEAIVKTVSNVSALPDGLRMDRMALLRVCSYISIKDLFEFMVKVGTISTLKLH